MLHTYRMGGNFRGVLIFVDFVGPTQTTKIYSKNHCTSTKITFCLLDIYLCSMSSPTLFRGTRGGTIPTTVRVSGVLREFNMAMLKYVRLLCDLPAPVAVQEETVPAAELQKKQRGKYQHFSPKENATIGRYASEHGVANTVKHFKEKVLKESTVQDWRDLYRGNSKRNSKTMEFISRKQQKDQTCCFFLLYTVKFGHVLVPILPCIYGGL